MCVRDRVRSSCGDMQTPRQTSRSKLCATRDPSWSLRMDTERHPSLPHTVAILSRGDAATRRDATPQAFRAEFPSRLRAGNPRVLKQNRGNGGQGVWKVEALPNMEAMVRVLHAQRGSLPEDMPLDAFIARCEPYFGRGGCII